MLHAVGRGGARGEALGGWVLGGMGRHLATVVSTTMGCGCDPHASSVRVAGGAGFWRERFEEDRVGTLVPANGRHTTGECHCCVLYSCIQLTCLCVQIERRLNELLEMGIEKQQIGLLV